MALTACTNALHVRESKFAQAEQVHCHQVTPTGSHRSRRVCTTRSERESDAAQAKAELERAMDYQRNQEMVDRNDQRVPTRP
jgi:hypothetical protein